MIHSSRDTNDALRVCEELAGQAGGRLRGMQARLSLAGIGELVQPLALALLVESRKQRYVGHPHPHFRQAPVVLEAHRLAWHDDNARNSCEAE